MPRDYENDVPGDVVASEAENLPGGFGSYDPDNDTDATVDELTDSDVRSPSGQGFAPLDEHGLTTGTNYTEAMNEGATVDPADLLAGEEGHPGAAVGFTGAENDKVAPPRTSRRWRPRDESAETPAHGGTPTNGEQEQQVRDMSVESQGPFGGQGAAGDITPPKRKAS